jgi:hypothetical protein
MRARLVTATAILATVAGSAFALAAPAAATTGNNGTIKVAEVAAVGTDSNDPHVGCTFALEWYNFDTKALSTVRFASIAPTKDAGLSVVSGRTKVTLENDAAKGNSDLDGREIYTLGFTGTPQKNQGFHVSVTTSTTGFRGSTTKSKTFWVGPCATQTDPGTTNPGTTDPGTTNPGTTDPGTTDPGTTDPGTTDPGTTDPEGPFSWDWEYDAPTCSDLTVDYPSNIPSGQANDVNVRVETPSGQVTMNFHNNTGTWSGTQQFSFADHASWPADLASYDVVWVQVGGTNYHWQGDVACTTDGDPTTPDVPQALTELSGFRSGTVTINRGSVVATDSVAVEQAGAQALTLEQFTDGTWQVARTIATNDRGDARVTFPRLSRKGTYRFRLTVSRTLSTSGATSAPLTVRVR